SEDFETYAEEAALQTHKNWMENAEINVETDNTASQGTQMEAYFKDTQGSPYNALYYMYVNPGSGLSGWSVEYKITWNGGTNNQAFFHAYAGSSQIFQIKVDSTGDVKILENGGSSWEDVCEFGDTTCLSLTGEKQYTFLLRKITCDVYLLSVIETSTGELKAYHFHDGEVNDQLQDVSRVGFHTSSSGYADFYIDDIVVHS
ncbi:MAG: hypothetical protein ACFFCS_18395, partial [Candidatus Hodarchaeota archaeon]